MRMIAYGALIDTTENYIHMAESTYIEVMMYKFYMTVMTTILTERTK
jgi:hypothetical protein